eukprot:scpid83883/ scgid27727/ 
MVRETVDSVMQIDQEHFEVTPSHKAPQQQQQQCNSRSPRSRVGVSRLVRSCWDPLPMDILLINIAFLFMWAVLTESAGSLTCWEERDPQRYAQHLQPLTDTMTGSQTQWSRHRDTMNTRPLVPYTCRLDCVTSHVLAGIGCFAAVLTMVFQCNHHAWSSYTFSLCAAFFILQPVFEYSQITAQMNINYAIESRKVLDMQAHSSRALLLLVPRTSLAYLLVTGLSILNDDSNAQLVRHKNPVIKI